MTMFRSRLVDIAAFFSVAHGGEFSANAPSECFNKCVRIHPTAKNNTLQQHDAIFQHLTHILNDSKLSEAARLSPQTAS